MKVSIIKNILCLSIILCIISCKKDDIFNTSILEGNLYDPTDSSGYVTIEKINVDKWGINTSGDTVTLSALVSLIVPESHFNESNVFSPVQQVKCVFYLNGVAYPVTFKDGKYTFNNYYRLMKDRENSLVLYAKLTERGDELKRISNTYVFRLN